MKLPNSAKARVDRRKITDYLLCESHPDGASKAEFFGAFGFRVVDWDVLADALKKHGQENPVVTVIDSPFGPRYTVEGPLEAPDGRRPVVVTVWIIDKGRTSPRLVTAYPGSRSGR